MPKYEITGPDGARYELDAPNDDAVHEAVSQMFGGAEPASSQGVPGSGSSANMEEAAAPSPTGFGRGLKIGTQGVGRGLADLAGLPFDLTNAAADLGLTAADSVAGLFGGSVPYRFGQSPWGGNAIANASSTLADALGFGTIDPEEMSNQERLGYNVNRFGGGSAIAGAGLAARAAQGAPAIAENASGLVDAFLRPYAANPAATFVGDVAAGAGSGAGVSLAQQQNWGPTGELLSGLLGGFGGATAAHLPSAIKGSAQSLQEALTSDLAIPRNPETSALTSNRVASNTARFVQETATDPQKAAANIGRMTDEAFLGADPQATSGLASGDIGLTALERGARLKNPVPFQEADQRLLDRAQERVTGLRDADANQEQLTKYVKERPRQLAELRDEEALPLLEDAQNSRTHVNVEPVAELVKQKLQTAKRRPVRNALEEVQSLLTKPGSKELDDSVSGLYETRKAINDIIEGRGENPTGRFAKSELIEIRNALDNQINEVVPEFGEYLSTYKAKSRPLDVFEDSRALKQLMQDDPRNVAQKLLSGSGYGTDTELNAINQVVFSSPDAKRGWRAAVAEVLADKVTNTNTALTGTTDGPVSVAKLQRVFKQHETVLEKVFSPQEMDSLRRAHKLLEPLGNLRRQAVTGSATTENKYLSSAFEAAILAHTGSAITTGMIMKRIRTVLNLVPGVKNLTLETKMGKLVDRMWFDPDLAQHLLTRSYREASSEKWNKQLQRLLLGANFAREREAQNVRTGDDPTLNAIMNKKSSDADATLNAISRGR